MTDGQPSAAGLTGRISLRSAEHPWLVISSWVLLLVGAVGLIVQLFGSAFTSEFFPTNNPESRKASDLVEERLRGGATVQEAIVVTSSTATVGDAGFEAVSTGIVESLRDLGPDAIASVLSYYETGVPSLVSEDGGSLVVPISLTGDVKAADDIIPDVYEIVDAVDGSLEFDVFITGESTFYRDFSSQAQHDAERGETIAAPLALIVLYVVSGTLVAALVPMLLAVFAIALAFGVAAVVGQYTDLHVFTQNIVIMVGLAVGIDYTLFVISRFREERARGRDLAEAIAVAGDTASRAVIFSGFTVVIALVGMLLVPHSAFFAIGLGAIVVVLVAVVAVLTLLPAVLALLGGSIERLSLPIPTSRGEPRRIWGAAVRGAVNHPYASLLLGAGALLAMSAIYLTIEIGSSGVATFPDHLRAKEGFDALREEFGFGLDAPVEVVIDGDIGAEETQEAIAALLALLEGDPVFGPPPGREVSADGDLALLNVPINGDPLSESVADAVRRLRSDYIPAAFGDAEARALVAGITAEDIELTNIADRWLPIVIGFVLTLSFVLVTVAFRSVVVAVSAVVMNLLSVGAAYGLIVLVFQHGYAVDTLGFTEVATIEPWLPLFLFAILFGLSMDYQVFLLSRIRERYDATGDNSESVVYGLQSTAGIITGAAMIMVVVFAGFASGELVQLQQMGFGLAVAIALDATLVRTFLVPATMQLLGDANWYFPSFLDWIPDIRVEPPVRDSASSPD